MSEKNKELENHLKAALLNCLIEKKEVCSDDLIISELPFYNWISDGRADLAIIRKNRMTAYEVKSAYDSLSRLGDQFLKYDEAFDDFYIVCAEKFLKSVIAEYGEHSGIYLYENNAVKKLQKCIHSLCTNKSVFLNYLDSKNLKVVAKEYGLKKSYSYSKFFLKEFVEKNLTDEQIKKVALESLRRKYARVNRNFWWATKGRKVFPGDLRLLSRNFCVGYHEFDCRSKRHREKFLNA